MVANETIKSLVERVNEQEKELNKLRTRKKPSQKTDNLSAGEF